VLMGARPHRPPLLAGGYRDLHPTNPGPEERYLAQCRGPGARAGGPLPAGGGPCGNGDDYPLHAGNAGRRRAGTPPARG
jgi:hypothetical protein